MKKTIPFTKELPFNTMISEITDIEVTHNLKINDNNTIDGSILVNGSYKMTEASQIEEKFDYDLPFTIEVDDKYDLSTAIIKINDFYFEIINEDTLKINVELDLSNVCEKFVEEKRCYDVEDAEILDNFDDVDEKIEVPSPIIYDNNTDVDTVNDDTVVNNIMDIFNSNEDNTNNNANNTNNNYNDYKSYYVYIVREKDTLDMILSKYNIKKDELMLYNNIENLSVGDKLIIPCSNE